ncbi:hypothetical protein C8A01DRAFT_15685 [Parachaetomium inaequale]|uniref:Uncharacterized protein n=1 Tax=Parachaetomium inaequale TaxID=2588326 RepID=A0AAN6SSJ1_9PEZI|nr:hypothetical protein C8A01DRAFT_15685 [Parachaetomium inaequale]
MRILIRFLPLISLCLAAKPCYFPNGELAPDYPCDPTAEESACCGVTALCLTNKLCRTPEGNLVRGTCTEKNWNTAECAQYCLSRPPQPTTSATKSANQSIRPGEPGKDLISCSNVTGNDPQYCCEGDNPGCCDSGKGRFPVLPPNPQVWAKWDASASSVVVLLQQTSSAASSSSSTSSSTATSSSPTSSTATITGTTTSSVATTSTTFALTTTTATTATGAAGETNPPSSADLPVAAKAGIGASVGVAVLLLAALAFVLWRLRQSKKVLHAERERAEAVALRGTEPPAGYDPKYILDGAPRSEMAGGYEYHYGYGESPATLELPATTGRSEVGEGIIVMA